MGIEEMIEKLRFKANNIKAKIEPEFFNEVADEFERYEVAFDLLLKDDCLKDNDCLSLLDELYDSRKEYYMNKAIETIAIKYIKQRKRGR